MKTISLLTVCLLFYFSGIAALTYEVLWVRHLGLIFGNTVYAAATVMMTYMFGLAVGAHYAGRWAKKIKNPVKVFGILEIATALYALCVPFIFEFIQHVYRFMAINVSDSLLFLTIIRVLLVLILLLIPTAMMGATLPVLAKGFLVRIEHFGSRLGVLYGVNTLGAVSGVLLAGFLFIPKLGMHNSNLVAVSLDAMVGFLAIIISLRLGKNSNPIAFDDNEQLPLSKTRSRSATWLLIALGISGFVSLAMEVVWFRALILVFGSTTYSFSAMLGIFLIGLSLGSFLISRFSDRIENPVYIFGGSAILISIYTLMSLPFFTQMPEFLLKNLIIPDNRNWGNMIYLKFLISIFFLLVPTILFGASFTAGVKAVRKHMNSSSEAVGDAAMFNTIGAALGAFFGGFILLPNTGMRWGLIICSFIILILGTTLIYKQLGKTSQPRLAHKLILLFSSIVIISLGIINPPKWDKHVLASGAYFTPWGKITLGCEKHQHIPSEDRGYVFFECNEKNCSLQAYGKVSLKEKLNKQRLLYYNEGITSTISVTKDLGEDLQYCSQGKVEADTTERSMMLQRMMGHLPMLFHPDPQRVVNIGLGAGVTFGAVSCYPAEHLEVVEFEPSVTNVAGGIWSEYNHNVLKKPNVKVTLNDGRNHLFISDEPYDVITSDPFEPVMAGAANLYTVDFFKLAKSRLAEGGIMAQYLPLYELSCEDYQMIIHSFVEVFPKCIVFFTGFDTILLGGNSKDALHLPIAAEKFNIPAVKESLAEIGFEQPEMLLSMFVAYLSKDDIITDEVLLNTDNRPYVEFSAPKSTFHYTPHENQQVLLKHYSPVPSSLMSSLTLEQQETIINSHTAMKLTLQANIEQDRLTNKYTGICEDLPRVTRMHMKAMSISPQNPVIANEMCQNWFILADQSRSSGLTLDALIGYKKILELKKTEFWPIFHCFTINFENYQKLFKDNKDGYIEYKKAGNSNNQFTDEKIEIFNAIDFYFNQTNIFLNYGLKIYPDSPLFIGLKGKYFVSIGKIDEGINLIKEAISLLPNYSPLQNILEWALSIKDKL